MKRKTLFKLIIILLPLLLFAGVLGGLELSMRNAGHQPGWLIDGGFTPVDTVIVGDFYYADSFGVVHHNPASAQWRPDQVMNSEGFLSKFEFDPEVVDSIAEAKGSYKVMLVGDSYTEGYSADIYDSSFAGILSVDPELTILNFGVGATDPVHYRQVVKKYVPKLKPDLVVVVICTENDGLWYDRTPKPFITPCYVIEGCGWLNSEPFHNVIHCENNYFATAQEAYDYYIWHFSLLGDDRPGWVKFCRQSALFTRFYLSVHKKMEFSGTCYGPEPPYTYQNLVKINDFCQEWNVPLLFVALPNVSDVMAQVDIREKYNFYFNELEWYSPEMSKLSRADYDFEVSPSHFINSGHRKFTDFMRPLVFQKLKVGKD